jgi:Glycosyl hydrolase family 9/Cellulase N-terminal ig-like domain
MFAQHIFLGNDHRMARTQTHQQASFFGLVRIFVGFSLFSVLAIHSIQAQLGVPDRPMQPVYQDGAEFRWLNKKVLDSRLLDGMEDLSKWSFKGDGDMSLSTAQVKDGAHSLRISSAFNIGRVDGGGDWQDLIATRRFPSEDWNRFNRISIWVYPDVDGAPAISASLILHNEGSHILPDNANEGRNESIPLKNREWNHVVWEIAPLSRDKITAIDFAYGLPKMFPDSGDKTILYIDQMELQTVVPDHVEGWDVATGKIAFSHAGYVSGSSKTAIASDLHDHNFSLVDADTGKIVLTRPVEQQKSKLGNYQLLDFSEVRQPGNYILRSGETTTRPFRIGDDAWRESIVKAINFMYSERCGTVIPGIHGICHQDDYSIHDDKRILVNGGYHDAGDLSATGNTPGMSYALFELAESLKLQGEDPVLYNRLIVEAEWGLRWALKTRFGDGYRTTGQLISYWTNGIMGDADDRVGEAVNDPEWNFRVAAVEALAARVLKDVDPQLANRSLATAEEDWKFAVEGLKTATPLPEIYGQKDELERISFGAAASIDLFRATGDQRYADEAVELGNEILASQERKLQPWSIPMTGYFYTSPKRENLFHRLHLGQEEEPIVALAHLCNALPENPNWMKWYSAIVLHSKYYQQPAAAVDAPYDMLPAAIYRESEASLLPQSTGPTVLKTSTPLMTADRATYIEEVRRGVPLGGEYYLRRFPVWFDFRGNSSVLLSEAKALSTAAQLRGDIDAEDLAQKQAQWIVGRNPFSASIMYGEGYDWTPLYSVRSGQMVGALPVGIETKGTADVPYWPNQSGWTYKEVWTQPAGEWIWLMRDLSGSAVVEGVADPGKNQPVQFVDRKTGKIIGATLDPERGSFRAVIPQGQYIVQAGTSRTSLVALPAGAYQLDLRQNKAVDFTVESKSEDSMEILLQLSAEGAGAHTFTARVDNLDIIGPNTIQVDLGQHSTRQITWHARVIDATSPWVAVVLQDGSLNQHRELTGIASTK